MHNERFVNLTILRQLCTLEIKESSWNITGLSNLAKPMFESKHNPVLKRERVKLLVIGHHEQTN